MSKIVADNISPRGSDVTIAGVGTFNSTGVNLTGIVTASSGFVGNVTGDATGLSGSPTLSGITSVSTTNLTVNGSAYPATGPLSNRNIIINGAMQVAQRNTQVTSVTTSGYKTVDRFTLAINSLGTWTIDQSSDAPTGFGSSFKMTCTSADASPASGDYVFIRHNIEAQNLQSLGYGTADAKAMTLSFWVKSNKTGSGSLDSRQVDNSNKLWSATYSISSADTWEYKTVAIPADTAGVIDNNNDTGLYIDWWLNSGSTFTGGSATSTTWVTNDDTRRNPSNLGVGGATSDYFAITGVQLEVGSVATPFEHRSYGDELERCERYFQLVDSFTATGYGSGAGISMALVFRKQMRASPSLSVTGVLYVTDSVANDYVQSSVTGSIVSNNRNERGCRMAAANFSGLTDYRPYQARPGLGGEIQLSAEL